MSMTENLKVASDTLKEQMDLLTQKLANFKIHEFDELEALSVWSYKDLEYVAKQHHFTAKKIRRLEHVVGQFFLQASQGSPCFRCDGPLDSGNINHSLGHFHHKECPKDSR